MTLSRRLRFGRGCRMASMVTVILACAACNFAVDQTTIDTADSVGDPPTSQTSGEEPVTSIDGQGTTSTAEPDTSIGGDAELTVVDCSAAIYAYPHRAEDWPEGSTIRILDPENTLVERFEPEDFTEVNPARVDIYKYVLVVNGAAPGPIEVRVAPEDQTWARLLYRNELTGSSVIAFDKADVAESFTACGDSDTQYAGGLVLMSTGCLDLIVHANQSPVQTLSLDIGGYHCGIDS